LVKRTYKTLIRLGRQAVHRRSWRTC
jgi:hypothetical protein